MSLFYQISKEVSNTTKPGWYLNYKNTRYNTKISKIYNLDLPYFNVPFLFSGGRALKGSFVSSNPIDEYEVNGSTNSDYNANLLASPDVSKPNPSLRYNNLRTISSIKK